jgi:hypothetical protein
MTKSFIKETRVKRTPFKTYLPVILAAALVVVLASQAFAQAQRSQPPEYKEIAAAMQIKDAAVRLHELERIKAAYPQSAFMARLDQFIFMAKVEAADSLEAVLALQRDLLSKSKGMEKLAVTNMAAEQILEHPKVKAFDPAAVTAAVLEYRDEAVKLSADPGIYQGIPETDRGMYKTYYVTGFDVLVAEADFNQGQTDKAAGELAAFIKDGGKPDDLYYFIQAGIFSKQGKTKEAYEAYLNAALEGREGAFDTAKEFYVKIHGKAEGFEADYESRLRKLSYEPEPYEPSPDWKGKAVLAEIFTGSECPPCVGADLGFDGLIEAYPSKVLAVLEYHLPIPRPDPMINEATKTRQAYYGVNSTPSTFFDGEAKRGGGGSRSMAGDKFKEYKSEIDPKINEAPAVKLQVSASKAGDVVTVECGFDKVVPGADYNVVLVQGEEKSKGSNGILFHKHVVRALAVLDPAAGKRVTFDLAALEKATDAYLDEFEKTYERIPNFKFPERHAKISRRGLMVVFFAQDKASKKVLNSAATEVK